MNILYKPTGFTCNTRKEMKQYLGKVSFYNKELRDGNIIINNYIANNELPKNNRENCG